MTAAWFEISTTDAVLTEEGIRYVLADPWGDYCRVGEIIPIVWAGDAEPHQALVTGHGPAGSALVRPLPDEVAVAVAAAEQGDTGGERIPGGVAPLPTREMSGSATRGEAS